MNKNIAICRDLFPCPRHHLQRVVYTRWFWFIQRAAYARVYTWFPYEVHMWFVFNLYLYRSFISHIWIFSFSLEGRFFAKYNINSWTCARPVYPIRLWWSFWIYASNMYVLMYSIFCLVRFMLRPKYHRCHSFVPFDMFLQLTFHSHFSITLLKIANEWC